MFIHLHAALTLSTLDLVFVFVFLTEAQLLAPIVLHLKVTLPNVVSLT